MALAVGSRLGHYSVTALIGEGGMDQVYQATHTKLNRTHDFAKPPVGVVKTISTRARVSRLSIIVAVIRLWKVWCCARTAQNNTLFQTSGAEALCVFLDCQGCDFDYLRTELPFVNYVRDRRDAQVHVLITREQTGGGGRAITIDFVGLEGWLESTTRSSISPHRTTPTTTNATGWLGGCSLASCGTLSRCHSQTGDVPLAVEI